MFLFQLRQQSPKTGLPDLNAHESDMGKRIQNISSWVREQIAPLQHTDKKQAVYDAVSNLEACGRKFSTATPEQRGRLFGEIHQGIMRLTNALSDAHVPKEKKGESIFEKVYSGNFDSYLWQTSSMAYEGISKFAEGQKMGKLGEEIRTNYEVSKFNDQITDAQKKLAPEIKKQWEDNRFFTASTTRTTTYIDEGGNQHFSGETPLENMYSQLEAARLGTHYVTEQPTLAFSMPGSNLKKDRQLQVDLKSNIPMTPDRLTQVTTNIAGMIESGWNTVKYLIPVYGSACMVDDGIAAFKSGNTGEGIFLSTMALLNLFGDLGLAVGTVTKTAVKIERVQLKAWGDALSDALEKGTIRIQNGRIMTAGGEVVSGAYTFTTKGGKLILGGAGKGTVRITQKALDEISAVQTILEKPWQRLPAATTELKALQTQAGNQFAYGKTQLSQTIMSNSGPEVKGAIDEVSGFAESLMRGQDFETLAGNGLKINGKVYSIVEEKGAYVLKSGGETISDKGLDMVLKAYKKFCTENPATASRINRIRELNTEINGINAQLFQSGKELQSIIGTGSSKGMRTPIKLIVRKKETQLVKFKSDEANNIVEVLTKNKFAPGEYKVGDATFVVSNAKFNKINYVEIETGGKVYQIKANEAPAILEAFAKGDGEKVGKLFKKYLHTKPETDVVDAGLKGASKLKGKFMGEKLELVDEPTFWGKVKSAGEKTKGAANDIIFSRLPADFRTNPTWKNFSFKPGWDDPKKFHYFELTKKQFEYFSSHPFRAPISVRWSLESARYIVATPISVGTDVAIDALMAAGTPIVGAGMLIKKYGRKFVDAMITAFGKSAEHFATGNVGALLLERGASGFLYQPGRDAYNYVFSPSETTPISPPETKTEKVKVEKTAPPQETKTVSPPETTATVSEEIKTGETKTEEVKAGKFDFQTILEMKNRGSFGSPQSAENKAMDWVIGRGSGNEFAESVRAFSEKNGGNVAQAVKDVIFQLYAMGLDQTKTREEINDMLKLL